MAILPSSDTLLQTTHHYILSLNWLSGSGISFQLKSVLAHPFLMQAINISLVWFSVIKSCSFWVFKRFSFSLSFWSSSKFSLAPASWNSKLLIGFRTQAARSTGVQFVFPFVAAFIVLTFVETSFVFNQHVYTFVQTAEFYWASAKSPSCNSFCCMLVPVLHQSPACCRLPGPFLWVLALQCPV